MPEIANDTPLYDIRDRSCPEFRLDSRDGAALRFTSTEGHVAYVFVLEQDVVRVMILPHGKMHSPRTWTVAPGCQDVPFEGIGKFDLSRFSCPAFEFSEGDGRIRVSTTRIRLMIESNGFQCTWLVCREGRWLEAAADRLTQAYNFGEWGDGVYHYLGRSADEMYFGLGEKAGDADRMGGVYRMHNVDGAFYSARTSDPLYKHIPFYITRKAGSGTCCGLFYDTYADCCFDMGREISNYHGPYRYFKAEGGDLDYYFIAGNEAAQVVSRFTWLTGQPMFPPKWSLGYSGSTMTYTDAPNAQARMGEFLEKCREHDIPCESFHMSSGYTTIGTKRYVFNWNTEKFPDARKFLADYLAAGVRVIANIKPALLKDHPLYASACRDGVFVQGAQGGALVVPFWGGNASYVDFTKQAAIDWWKGQVRRQLLDYGVTSTWNDNNEFEIMEAAAYADGFGSRVAARDVKPLQTLLMLKASVEAQREFAPARRPFAVSRAGLAGMQRYVQTWSGDNYTSWETLKYNIKMGLGLSMSGVFNTGHDVGGFLGPAPDMELFVRWVQFGIFMPRFSIHSENAGGVVTEPWMYPAATPVVRNLIGFRHRLQPYFYDLLWRAHHDYQPVVRPTWHTFPADENCYAENDDMMVGDFLLHAAVVAPGVRSRRVYLPAGSEWFDFWSGAAYSGGQTVEMAAPLERPLLFARAGAVIAWNAAEPHFGSLADRRAFVLFPPAGVGAGSRTVFEDDGETEAYRQGACGQWRIDMASTGAEITVSIDFSGDRRFRQDEIAIEIPATDERRVVIQGARLLGEVRTDSRRAFQLSL